jgi:hypothetical protein
MPRWLQPITRPFPVDFESAAGADAVPAKTNPKAEITATAANPERRTEFDFLQNSFTLWFSFSMFLG